jgi:hypothetical protein
MMKHNTWHLLLALGVGLASTLLLAFVVKPRGVGADPVTRYVAPDGDDGKLCDTIADRCRTVQRAVDVADHFDEIRVAGGTYTGVHSRPVTGYLNPPVGDVITQAVYISKTVTIQGGYDATFAAAPDPEGNPTTLDAQGAGRVIVIAGENSPTIAGLYITGGDASGLGGSFYTGWDTGGGVYIANASPILTDNDVVSNTASVGGGIFLHQSAAEIRENTLAFNSADDGGGLYGYAGTAAVSRNTVTSNTANSGGGIALTVGRADVSGNTIAHNTAYLSGGGLYLDWMIGTVEGNTFVHNTAHRRAGGVWLHESDLTLTNNVVAGNQGTSGSGVYVRSSSPALVHTTIARNSGGSGIQVSDVNASYSTVALTNTILVSHSVGISVTGGNTVTVNGVLWDALTPVTVSTAVTATASVQNEHTGDPAFVGAGSYHIDASSDAIDNGVSPGSLTDIDGEPRLGAPDLGADEYVRQVHLPSILRGSP